MATFWMWVIILTIMLSFPATNLIWVMSVRRLQRKLKKELSEEEITGQKQRARFLAIFLSFVFSFLFVFSLRSKGLLIGT